MMCPYIIVIDRSYEPLCLKLLPCQAYALQNRKSAVSGRCPYECTQHGAPVNGSSSGAMGAVFSPKPPPTLLGGGGAKWPQPGRTALFADSPHRNPTKSGPAQQEAPLHMVQSELWISGPRWVPNGGVLFNRLRGDFFVFSAYKLNRDPYIIHLNIATCKWRFPFFSVLNNCHMFQLVAKAVDLLRSPYKLNWTQEPPKSP